jgi:DNA-binding SARP family transcriptional activator
LLGVPEIVAGTERREIAGHKSWGVLAYLLLEPRTPSRRDVADLLFADADDPLAALRWQLVRVRRALGMEAAVVDDHGRLAIRPQARLHVDARELLKGDVEPAWLMSVGDELLAGLRLDDVEPFAWWLRLTRSRLRSTLGDALRRAATIELAHDSALALPLAERAVRLDPFDDRAHELVVSVLVGRGDVAEAAAYADRVERRYRSELATSPGPGLRRPLENRLVRVNPLIDHRVAARAGLDAAQASYDAGSYEAALDRGRRAANDAALSGDAELEARALVLLAAILAHSLRGRDHEAAGLLDRALGLAIAMGNAALAAEVERERAYVGLIDGDYGAAEAAARRSITLARDDGKLAIEAVSQVWLGACQLDRGDPDAEATLTTAMDTLARAGDHRWPGYAEAWLARCRTEAGDPVAAVRHGDMGVSQTRAAGWVAVLPWAMITLGDALRAGGQFDAAASTYADALALGEEIGDPCWEALSLRGFAYLALHEGQRARAIGLLRDAFERTHRYADIYKWAEAAIATDLVELEHGRDPVILGAATRLVLKGPMIPLAARLQAVIGPIAGI